MQNIFSFLILLSLAQKIAGDSSNITEQNKIATRPRVENNFGETPSEAVITTAISVDGRIFGDNEVQEKFEPNFKLNKTGRERNKNDMDEIKQQRKSRDLVNWMNNEGTVCLSCFARSSTSDDDCYTGTSFRLKKEICSAPEICFTELHPTYIKRGCIVPWTLNRTFVCKCPLCNDKPADDTTYYTYRRVSEWEYDNQSLRKTNTGMNLLCKVCQTKGTNVGSDGICKAGKNTDYMLCGRNQICYTSMDSQMDFVSRGCIDRPVYNSIYFFCNKTACNNKNFYSQQIKTPGIIFRSFIPLVKSVSSSPAVKCFINNLTALTMSSIILLLFN